MLDDRPFARAACQSQDDGWIPAFAGMTSLILDRVSASIARSVDRFHAVAAMLLLASLNPNKKGRLAPAFRQRLPFRLNPD